MADIFSTPFNPTYPSKNAHAAHDFEIQTSAREMVGRRADGSSVPIDIAMSEFDGPDGSLHIALVRDITEQKSMQSQLIQASKLATVGEKVALNFEAPKITLFDETTGLALRSSLNHEVLAYG